MVTNQMSSMAEPIQYGSVLLPRSTARVNKVMLGMNIN